MSLKLHRRTFLRGAGVACALPFLECMAPAVAAENDKPPKRICFVYFPNGVGLPPEDNEHHQDWSWFPNNSGAEYELTNSLKPLEDYRSDISILGGLSHPLSRRVLGHAAGDTWLTGGDVRGSSYKNRISVDQLAARTLGEHTRFPSLSLSTDLHFRLMPTENQSRPSTASAKSLNVILLWAMARPRSSGVKV